MDLSLKKDMFLKMGVGLKIEYSYIGQLKVIVPWNQLQSKAVEVELEKVFVICSAV